MPAGPGAPARSGPPERLAGADWPAPGERVPPAGSRPGEGRAGTGSPGDKHQDRDRLDPADRGRDAGRPGAERPDDREGWPAHDDEYSDASDLPPPGDGEDDSAALSPAHSENDAKGDGALPPIDHGDAGQPSTNPHEDPPPGGLSADLVVDGDRVAVSLVGVSGDGPGIPYGWRAADQAPPVAVLPVVLGDRDGRRLHLDLGRCPDVLTVTGALADCEKYALRLVRQLLGSGHGVAVVGDGLFVETLPDGCLRVPTMADVRRLNSPGVVVCGRLTGPDAAAARLSRASGGPTPMIIGEVPRSRWSVRVQSA